MLAIKRLLTLLLVFAIPVLTWSAYSANGHTGLIEAENLAEDARQGRPIILLVSQDHCPFCVQIKREVLKPLIKSGEFSEEILIRELFIDLGTEVTDFQGKRRPSADLAQDYGADLTPTLLFLGPGGEELSERIIGINTLDLFVLYVDSAIKESIAALVQRR
ncbi:MAG: thioredoxin fold domain-containing protein [Sedimenticola sp.]